MKLNLKQLLKQILAAGALVTASTAAFADVSVPAGYEDSSTAPDGATTSTESDGGLVFYLFSTSDTNYSLTYYLGLDLSDFTYSETDDDGLTLTWTIDASLYEGYDLSTMVWGVAAGDNGTQNQGTGATNLLTTVDTSNESATTTATNQGIITATNGIETQVAGANEDADPVDVNTTAYNSEDVSSNMGENLGISSTFDWTADASDSSATLAMYLYSQVGGRGEGSAETTATQYAGVWSFDAETGTLTYTVSAVPVPAALWLLLSGLGGLGVIGRRRQA